MTRPHKHYPPQANSEPKPKSKSPRRPKYMEEVEMAIQVINNGAKVGLLGQWMMFTSERGNRVHVPPSASYVMLNYGDASATLAMLPSIKEALDTRQED